MDGVTIDIFGPFPQMPRGHCNVVVALDYFTGRRQWQSQIKRQLLMEMCKQLGIPPTHPQSDGLVERFNRTLGAQVAVVVVKDQKYWELQLTLVLVACCSATQDTTGCTPALLMLGRELRTPTMLLYGHTPDNPKYWQVQRMQPN